jgi:hypothetical protein
MTDRGSDDICKIIAYYIIFMTIFAIRIALSSYKNYLMSKLIQPNTSTLTLVPLSLVETETTLTAPATQPKERHLTVSGKWFSRTDRHIEAPEIRLSGVYLQKLGFTIGSKVTVIENPGEIIVRLDGVSAQRNPEETADDRRLARKTRQVADFQKSAQKPLSEKVIAQYLSGKMSVFKQDLVYKLVHGEMSEPYRSRLYDLLDNKTNPAFEKTMCESLLWEINQLPKSRRKLAVKQTAILSNHSLSKALAAG